ncbi:putative polypeptide N-acetylgalactosaminyltransferase 9 isoform X2 [Planococcus citri]|uniref:putative polypeptide N-acetylgalactosaminyltransferase 9 isoform X2 n=1 Tax=Planococcus citri TaxID=170843 RepID=UPI0031F8E297
MSFSVNPVFHKMYTYISRRRALLFKGALLIGTVWLTVAVLIFMENKENADMRQQIHPAVYDNEGDLSEQVFTFPFDAKEAKELRSGDALESKEEDPLEMALSGEDNAVSIQYDDLSVRKGIKLYGEMGKPVVLPANISSDVKKLVSEGWQKNAFNQYVSDLISVHRTLPDPRDEWCKEPGRYLKNLPATSVIICFHNEAWSVLLRTVHSVIERSPAHLLKEIILVDDYSSMPHLKRQLEDYMAMFPKVKIIRASKREGLIRARLIGAKHASAPVLTYLDSHCECTIGWLEPLLDRIARDSHNVVTPVIDVIDDTTLAYRYQNDRMHVGGFDWSLTFNWHSLPERERKRHSNPAEPVHSPTMAGGLFSIDRKFFERLGTYDSGFDIWGGENLELSFKTWMCGGVLEIVPCSHVGHIFRKRSPYKWRSGVNVLKKNSIRLAKVWMDDYAKYYFQRIGSDLGDYGDITSRTELRKKLKCKSFKWYLDNVYPELFVPGDSIAQGEVRNFAFNGVYCLDSPTRKADTHKAVGLYPCHKMGGNQYWLLSKNGEIRRDEMCIDYAGTDVFLFPCHGSRGNQMWIYKPQENVVQHGSSKKCLAISEDKKKLTMEPCNANLPRQRWKFETYNATAFDLL